MNLRKVRPALAASAAILVFAGLIVPPSMLGVAEAKKEGKDPEDEGVPKDLDIKSFGFSGKKAFVEVYGKAGRTLADHENEAIAYVIWIVTSDGEEQIWAIDSHERQHGDSGTGSEWHGHRVHLTGANGDCLNEVDQVTHAKVNGNKATFEDMRAKGKNGVVENVDAVEITQAATVRLELQVEDPDNPPPGTECIAIVAQIYDTA